LRFVRDLPSNIAIARAHAWIVALRQNVLAYFSAVSQPGSEIWYDFSHLYNLDNAQL
jgi:hypothetical protein